MRLFIAMKLPETTLSNLEKIQNQLQRYGTGSYAPKANLHLTLKFLGDVSTDKLFRLQTLLDKCMSQYTAPTMSIQHVTTLRPAGVVVAKLKSDRQLYDMEEYLATELDKMGITVEMRAYTPHITLLRRYHFDLPFSEVSKNITIYNKPFIANELVLFESTLSPYSPPQYTELYSVKLK